MKACFYTIETYKFRHITDDAITAVKKHYDLPFHRFMVNNFEVEAPRLFGKLAAILLDEYDRVIFYGTDQIMFDKCPKLFDEYDIAAPLNNNSGVNGGLVSISSKDAALEWSSNCNNVTLNESQVKLYSICFKGKYKSVILDGDEPMYGIKHHNEFLNAEYKDGKLIIAGKQHLIMHFAGQMWTDMSVPRIKYEVFKPSVQDKIKELIS